MADVTNTTASSGLSVEMKTFYSMELLREMKPKLLHVQYGQKRAIPKNHGKNVEFRQWGAFEPATKPLTEGVTPEGHAMSATAITATVAQYGDYVRVTDMLKLTALDNVVLEATRANADQAALTLDHLTRDAIAAGTNVLYAAGTQRSAIASTNVLTSTLLRKAVRTLKKNKARPFFRNGKPYYMCIVGPDTTYDLQSDADWKDVSKYQQAEKIESGEIGRIYGCIIVETTEAKIFEGAGASSADVAATLVFGQDSYGVIDVSGAGAVKSGAVQVYVETAGGNNDPLHQRNTIGWKIPAFVAKILHQGWIVRIEHGISA
jgi:N4-gp56 family major capsid protein